MIRKAFIPEKGNVLISSDYSQIELRLIAHIADEKNLINAFLDEIDVHSSTASEVFNVPLNDKLQVVDNTRIYAAKPTIDYVLNNGGSCILISHMGRPQGFSPDLSLKNIVSSSDRLPSIISIGNNLLDNLFV